MIFKLQRSLNNCPACSSFNNVLVRYIERRYENMFCHNCRKEFKIEYVSDYKEEKEYQGDILITNKGIFYKEQK